MTTTTKTELEVTEYRLRIDFAMGSTLRRGQVWSDPFVFLDRFVFHARILRVPSPRFSLT